MLKYAVAASGSSGNCYIFYNGTQSIVVDYGISTKKFTSFLKSVDIPIDSIQGIFITHLHPDHASRSLKVVQKSNSIPVYINSTAAKCEHSTFVSLELDSSLVKFFCVGDEIIAGDFNVYTTSASHDSQGCVSYFIKIGEYKICLITDTGFFTQEMISYAKDCDLLFLEADYDDKMLDENEDYPQKLKIRIRSDYGHLSNDQAKRFLLKVGRSENREVFLIHLSENNNTAECAQEATKEALELNKFIFAIPHGSSLYREIH